MADHMLRGSYSVCPIVCKVCSLGTAGQGYPIFPAFGKVGYGASRIPNRLERRFVCHSTAYLAGSVPAWEHRSKAHSQASYPRASLLGRKLSPIKPF